MKIHIHAITATVAICMTAQAQAADVPAACTPPTVFTTALDHLDGYRFFVGKDGDTEVAPYRIDAKLVPMLKTGKTLGILNLPTAPKRGVEIVVGPPNVEIGFHPTPYKEMFVLLGGSTLVKTKKFSAEMKPGSVLLFDDGGAKTGHAGRTGPCGYISLSVAP